MDISSLKPVKGLTVVCKCSKEEFNGQRNNSLVNYHLGTKPLVIANDALSTAIPKNIGICPATLCLGGDKYNGSRRYDNTPSAFELREILTNLMRYSARQKNHLERK